MREELAEWKDVQKTTSHIECDTGYHDATTKGLGGGCQLLCIRCSTITAHDNALEVECHWERDYMQQYQCGHDFNLPRSFEVSTGVCGTWKAGALFAVKHKGKKTLGRIAPYLCTFCVLGLVISRKKGKTVYSQSFLGLTDPVSMLFLFLSTAFILHFSSKGGLEISQVFLIAAVCTVCIAILTFCATSLSPMGRDGKKEVENVLKTACGQGL